MSVALGEYAVPVLSAWLTALVVLGALVVLSLRSSARARRALDAEERARDAAARPAPAGSNGTARRG